MKVLFDTHAFIWWDSRSAKLSRNALALIQDPSNTLLLSVVSIWEIQIKIQLGKLTLSQPLADVVESEQTNNNVQVLPLTVNHILALESLPPLHKDPFDRILIAQANLEDAVLVSGDAMVARYPVRLVW